LSFENVQFDESTRSFINDNAKFISDNKKMTQFVKLNTKSNNKKNVKVNRQVDNRWTQIKNYTLNFNISGRVLINVWRIAEFELKLKNYSLESVIFHLFKKREPVFSNWTLTQWWDESRESRSRTLNYIRQRLIYTEEILNRLNTIPLTVEMTKLYGIDFDSVVS
jgi:DNA polymerase elongation subunit (family B)